MDADELKLAREKLAIEIRLKRIDQELARRQLFGASRGWRAIFTPTGAAVAGAVLALLGTAAGKWGDYLTTRRQQETNLILKASEVPATVNTDDVDIVRARNLLFFAEAGFVRLPSNFVSQLRDVAKLHPGQSPGAPIIQSSSPQQLASATPRQDELAIADNIRNLVDKKHYAEAVGLFDQLHASIFSGVGFYVYPKIAFAFDQISKPDDSLRVLGMLEDRLKLDAQKGYGYLAPGRPPREFLKHDLEELIPQVLSPAVKSRMQKILSEL